MTGQSNRKPVRPREGEAGVLFGQSSDNRFFGESDGAAVVIDSNGNADGSAPTFAGSYTGNEFGTGFFSANADAGVFNFGYRFRNGAPTRTVASPIALGAYVGPFGNAPTPLVDGLDFSDFGGFTPPTAQEIQTRATARGAAGDARDIATFDGAPSAFLDDFAAIAVGQRLDGKPGAWAIKRGGTVVNPRSTAAGGRTSDIGSAQQASTSVGWRYEATAVSSDGKLIVGRAVAPTDLTVMVFGNAVTVPEGTSIGMYWTTGITMNQLNVGRAKPLGNPSTASNGALIGMEDGLAVAEDVYYDAALDVYVVSGTDEDGFAAIVTVDL